jgi:mannan endo-1,4-beta-mannosidase
MHLSRPLALAPLALWAAAFCGCASSPNEGTTDPGKDAGTDPGKDAVAPPPSKPGFYVSGRFLYDKCGNKVVLRGVNEMIIWSGDTDGSTIYPEIAKTGANVVRIVWTSTGGASALDATIQNALGEQMIPMVENHDATGDLTKVAAVVDYWTRSDIVSVLKKYEDKLLLNIANEAGGSVFEEDYLATYLEAIQRLRAAGYGMPLVIDAPGYGVNTGVLLSSGPDFLAADPLGNILLSTHLYLSDATGDSTRSRLNDSIKKDLPMIVGEFADTKVGTCSPGSYNVAALMEAAQQNEIGWLAWSWGAVKNNDCPGQLDMTSDGTFDGLKDWGLAVAIEDPNSIKNTSVRSPYIVNGTCD